MQKFTHITIALLTNAEILSSYQGILTDAEILSNYQGILTDVEILSNYNGTLNQCRNPVSLP